ncbi:hypothetical protein CTI12_AA405370 [Artemisia annua]|uniref:Uncharacterized protein n=1 Tax=Artemisia annua TaxID=35608 RepID=A0A2U1M9K3_ARTAN|nr:hypothetical protein CTI12_AA405370 [Artemisia annua]
MGSGNNGSSIVVARRSGLQNMFYVDCEVQTYHDCALFCDTRLKTNQLHWTFTGASEVRKVFHEACVNRIRAMKQRPHLYANWGDTGHVQICEFSSHLNALVESENNINKDATKDSYVIDASKGYQVPLKGGNLETDTGTSLANKKTVTIQPAGSDQSILLATSKTKKQAKPASLLHKSVMKKEFYRMAKAVSNQSDVSSGVQECLFYQAAYYVVSNVGFLIVVFFQVGDNFYKPDLKKAALTRLSAVNRSLKVTKSGAKKKNRQAFTIRDIMSIEVKLSLNVQLFRGSTREAVLSSIIQVFCIVSGCIPAIVSDELEIHFEGILDYRKIVLFVSSSDTVQLGWLLAYLRICVAFLILPSCSTVGARRLGLENGMLRFLLTQLDPTFQLAMAKWSHWVSGALMSLDKPTNEVRQSSIADKIYESTTVLRDQDVLSANNTVTAMAASENNNNRTEHYSKTGASAGNNEQHQRTDPVLVFVGYVVVEAQEIIEKAHFEVLDYVKNAVALFTNFVVVFVCILIIMKTAKFGVDQVINETNRLKVVWAYRTTPESSTYTLKNDGNDEVGFMAEEAAIDEIPTTTTTTAIVVPLVVEIPSVTSSIAETSAGNQDGSAVSIVST